MTKETSQAGPKKFLYTGPQKSTSLFDDDRQPPQKRQEYSFTSTLQQGSGSSLTSNPTLTSSGGDVSDVWSLRKNVPIPTFNSQCKQRMVADCGTRNAGTSFYSRYSTHGNHTGASDEFDFSASNAQKKEVKPSVGQQKTFSYSSTNVSKVVPPSGTVAPPRGRVAQGTVAPSVSTRGPPAGPLDFEAVADPGYSSLGGSTGIYGQQQANTVVFGHQASHQTGAVSYDGAGSYGGTGSHGGTGSFGGTGSYGGAGSYGGTGSHGGTGSYGGTGSFGGTGSYGGNTGSYGGQGNKVQNASSVNSYLSNKPPF